MTRVIALFTFALALAACDVDMATPDLAGTTCPTTCGTCPTGTSCVAMFSGPTPFAATCLASCQTNVDCTGGRSCVAFQGFSQRYCVNSMEPQACGVHCELTAPTRYCSGSDVVTNYQAVVCGLQYSHCVNGCAELAPDGGLDRQATCL
jgi:hypothetical protein